MGVEDVLLIEKIRQQFDTAPYPRIPLDRSPQDDANLLFSHSLVTPFYLRNRRQLHSDRLTILDVGCGNGFTSHILAAANPGATIVGIDLSAVSIQMARERLQYHHVPNVEFYAMSVESVPSLGWTFDYINCDEVLYLLPDLVGVLKILKSTLKPEGILRGNLHSFYQRIHFYRAQRLFQRMGLMNSNPGEMEVQIVLETLRSLKADVPLKTPAWVQESDPDFAFGKVLMNYLFLGDKGFTIPDLFAALHAADLEFISMVNWMQWDLRQLFKQPDNLPSFWEKRLPNLAIETQLQMFELMCPTNRLLDFWCGNPGQAAPSITIQHWQPEDWQRAQVSLHPQIKTQAARAMLIDCVANQCMVDFSQLRSAPTMAPVAIDPLLAACLLPLWEQPQPIAVLVDRWLKIRPLDPVMETSTQTAQTFEVVRTMLTQLEASLYVLLTLPV